MRLTSLTFKRGSLDRSSIAALAPSLGLLTDLKRLELRDLVYGGPAVSGYSVNVGLAVAGLVSLEHLVVGCIGISTEDAKRMLPSLTALRRLDLRCDYHPTSDIAPALASLRALTHLDLKENYLWEAEESMVSISATLSLLTRLLYLDLDYNGSGACCGAAAIAALGHSLPPSLTHLSMLGNYLGAAGILAFAPGLGRLTTLRHLNLSESFDDANMGACTGSFRALAGCLERMPGLTSLDLSFNNIDPECSSALTSCLHNLQHLQQLRLSHNDLGVSGAQQLATCLPRMPKLQGLYLDGNDIGDVGFAALIGSLVDLPSLTELAVSENYLTTAAVEALAAAIHGTVGPQALTPIMGKLASLTLLDFSTNEISRDDVVALERPGRTIYA